MQQFNWENLYPLANDLVKNLEEAYIRTGTNRYYYMAYNLIRNYLIRNNKLDPNLKYNVHQTILNILKHSNNQIDKQLYENISILRNTRIIADYDESYENILEVYQNIKLYKKKAENIIQILKFNN